LTALPKEFKEIDVPDWLQEGKRVLMADYRGEFSTISRKVKSVRKGADDGTFQDVASVTLEPFGGEGETIVNLTSYDEPDKLRPAWRHRRRFRSQDSAIYRCPACKKLGAFRVGDREFDASKVLTSGLDQEWLHGRGEKACQCLECGFEGVLYDFREPCHEEIMRWFPRICAHIICHSLGYATPSCAARILKDALYGEENGCEWIASCYRCDPRPAVELAIRGRHTHEGFMAHYPHAIALVRRALSTGQEPALASWF